MSFHVASICTLHKFGSATRKQVITFLADKASDDGSGIWCSKGTVAQSTELSKSTVKRVFQQFLNEGILIETGKRKNKNGFTATYCINLDKILELPLTKEEPETTEFTVTPVQGEPPRGVTVNRQEGSPRTPNHPSTILEPPTRKRDGAEGVFSLKDFEAAWGAFPEDRRRNKETCQQIFEEAVSQGVAPEDILAAVQAYAQTTAGYTRGKVKFSDNWFRSALWEDHVAAQTEEARTNELVLRDSLARCKDWIVNRNPMCMHISKAQIEALIASGDVIPSMLIAAGIER